MSVDRAKDTSSKKRSPRTRLSKPSRNPLPRLKTNRTLHRKSKVWARVRSQYPEPTRTTGTTFLGKRKSDSACRLHGGPMRRGSFGVRWRCWEKCQCSYQVGKSTFGPVIRSVRTPSSDGKMTSSVSAKSGSLRSAGSSDGLKSAGLIGG